MSDSLGEACLTLAGLAVFYASIDELDAVDVVSGMLRMEAGRLGTAGEQDHIARFWKRVKRFQRNKVHGGAVVEDELKAVFAVDEALASLFALLPVLVRLIVGADEGGQTNDKAEEARVRRDARDVDSETKTG